MLTHGNGTEGQITLGDHNASKAEQWRIDKSIVVLRALLQRVSNDDDAAQLHREIGVLLAVTNDTAGALESMESAFRRSPGSLAVVRSYRKAAVRAQDALKTVAAIEAEARILGSGSYAAALHVERARILRDQLNQREAARLAYREALDQDPNDVAALLALAELAQLERDDVGAAIALEDLSNAVSDPVLAGELRGRSVLYREADGDHSTAYLHAVGARVHAPNSVAIQFSLERLYTARKEASELCEAREAQITAGAIDPQQGWFDIGILARYRLQDDDYARRAFERACELASWQSAAALDELIGLVEQEREWPRWLELMAKRVGLEPHKAAAAHLWFRIALVLETQVQDYTTALQAYERALAQDATYVPALEGSGRVLQRTAGPDRLIDMYRLEARTAPTQEERAAAQVRIARLLALSPDTQQDGINLLTGVLELVPGDRAALDALAAAYVRTKKWKELIEVYEQQARDADPAQQSRLYTEIGMIAADRIGDRKLAIAAFENVTEPDRGGVPPGLVRLASLLEEEGEWTRVVDVIEQMMEHITDDGELASALERLAGIYEQLGIEERAMDAYARASNTAPPGHPALTAAARAYLRAERYEDLATTYERAGDGGPPVRQAYWRTRLAHVLAYNLDRTDDAIAALRSALEALPSYDLARRSLAELLGREKRWEELAALLSTGADRSHAPNRGLQALRLGVLAESVQSDDAAAKYYAEALAAGIDDAQLPYLRLIGAAEQAEKIYAGIRGGTTREVHARYRAGEIAARRANGRADAIAHYEEALQLDPNNLAVCLALLPLLADRPERRDELLASLSMMTSDPSVQALFQLRRAELTPDPERALAIRRRAVESSPLHPINSVIVELAFERTGDRSAIAKLLRAQAAESTLEPELRPATLLALGLALEELGHTRDSADAFEKACGASTSLPPWLALLALPRLYRTLQNTQAFVGAVRNLADRLPAGPERATCLSFLGRVSAATGDRHGALDALEDALAVRHDHYAALLEIEQLCEDDPSRYIDSLTRCFELAEQEPVLVQLGTTLAARLLQEERYESAVEVIDRVLACTPNDMRALMLSAEVEERREMWDYAVIALEKVFDHPQTPIEVRGEALERLARIMDERLEDKDRLWKVAKRLDALTSDSTAFLRVALEVHKRVGDHSRAADTLAKLVEAKDITTSQRSEYLIALARVQDSELGEPAAAIETLGRVTDVARQADAIGQLLELGERSGRWDLACGALTAALGRGAKMDPTWELAIRRRLADLLEGPLGRPDDASVQYARIAELDKNDGQSLERLATLEESRDPAKALEVHRSLLRLDPRRISSYRKMRALFLAANNEDGAFCAEAVLVGLGVANEEEDYFHRQRLASLREGAHSPLDAAELDALCPERHDIGLQLLAQIEPLLLTVFPSDLAGQGVDVTTSTSSPELKSVAAALGPMFGAAAHVVAAVADRIGPTVELADKIVLLVPRSAEAETRRFQRLVCGALFGRACFHGIATDQRRLNPINPRHLEHMMWAACSIAREDLKVPDEGAIYKDIRKRVAAAMTPPIKAGVKELVDRLVATPDAISGDRLGRITSAAAVRTGMLAALDPAEAIVGLGKLKDGLGLEPHDHISFIVSAEHLDVRRKRGWGVKS